MSTSIMPTARQRYYTNSGTPAAGCKLYTYAAGTTTPKATFTDAAGTVQNTNPITLDSKGEALIYWTGSYKVDLKTAAGVQITGFPVDNVISYALLVDTLRSDLAASTGAGLIGFMPAGVNALATTVESKLLESVSSDDYLTLQAAIDTKEATLNSKNYGITNALKLLSLSLTKGKNAGIAMTGVNSVVKHSISKTGNATTAITNFQTGIVTNRDCLAYLDPAWIDAGAAYPQKMALEHLGFKGDAATPNVIGLYIEQGGGLTLRDLDFVNTANAIWAKECWLTVVERVHAFGSFVWQGGTSVTFNNCWTGPGPGALGGFSFASLIYSTMNSCASDGALNSAYRFVNSKLTLNSCGCENATTATANSGTAIAFDGGNEVVLNGFNVVPQVNQTVAIFTVGGDNTIIFNGGSSSFSVSGVNCPDVYVWGANSTVIMNDYTFFDGFKDSPVIQFAVGTSSSKVIVNYGSSQKIYTTDGAGLTLIETVNETGVWTPTAAAAAGSITTYTSFGTWVKNGKSVTLTGSLTITNNGTGSIQGFIGGIPTALAMAGGSGGVMSGCYTENTISGALCSLSKLTTTTMASTKYDGAYPWATGATISFTVTYQVA